MDGGAVAELPTSSVISESTNQQKVLANKAKSANHEHSLGLGGTLGANYIQTRPSPSPATGLARLIKGT